MLRVSATAFQTCHPSTVGASRTFGISCVPTATAATTPTTPSEPSSHEHIHSIHSEAAAAARWRQFVAVAHCQSNTIFNIVPQGHKYVVERFGKLHSIQDSGLFLVPVVDKISYVIDVSRTRFGHSQAAITETMYRSKYGRFIRFQDPERPRTGRSIRSHSVTQQRAIAMRSAIGVNGRNLHGRARPTQLIKGILQEASEPWGWRFDGTKLPKFLRSADSRVP
jgi:hypothetical protein